MALFRKVTNKFRFWYIKKGKKDSDLYEIDELKHIIYLKDYHKYCKQLIELHHKLYFGKVYEKADLEHSFGMLSLIRTKDYFLGTISSILHSHYNSAISILRSFTENLFLLKYLQKKPEYISKFMRKENQKFYNIVELKKEVADSKLNEYYHFLCLLDHSNRIALKQTYYKKEDFQDAPSDTVAVITDVPLDYKNKQVLNLISALNLYKSCLEILEEIMNKQWRKHP